MTKHFEQAEDIMSDELFLAWYYRESEEQVNAWENWLAANPHQQELVNQAISFMDHLPKESQVSADRVETKLAQLNNRIDEMQVPVIPMKTTRKRWWIAAAAAVLLLAGAFAFFQWDHSARKLDARYGETCTKELPDGSTMILNANSTAELSEGWEDGKDREVWLKGEAFFKVTKTPQKSRFIVHTDNLDVIVTGTQFNVLNRDNKTTVLLTEGSVLIRTKDGKQLAMKPGDYVEMLNNLVASKQVKEENILAWKENKLAFDSTSLEDIAQMIYHHYGLKVTLKDNVASTTEPLTGIMSNNNLDDLLKAIEAAANIRITKTDKEIVFSANN